MLGRAENAAIQALTPGVTSRVLSSEKKSQADATYRNKGSVSSESESNLRLEIGHVLFIDLVGYSALLIEEQRERLNQLTEVVLETAQVQAAPNEQLIRLPTGDGMALVFRHSSEEPARCALEVAEALKAHPKIAVRMGIHSGPVSEVTDVSGRINIAGAGINMAQRVMDCGDAGHILLSQRAADDLAQYRQWAPQLHDLGECEVKHGVRLHLFSLHTEEAGNPALPDKLRKPRKARRSSGLPSRRVLKTPRRGWLMPATVGIALAAAGLAFLSWRLLKSHSSTKERIAATSGSPSAASIPEKSIAVLPFENLSAEKANEYFADGIQDEILTKLAGIADLKVISRTSTAKYKSHPQDLATVSTQLGVAKVLEGTVQKAADKVRINVQLIDARTDSHLWARTFDGEAKEIFAVESKVAQEVADSLQARLSPAEANKLAMAPTRDLAAYDLFLKAEYEERSARSTLQPESFHRAAEFYQQAIDRDPHFALAMAQLVSCRMIDYWFNRQLNDAQLAEIKALADRALSLSPNLAPAHISLGVFYYYGHRQYDEALREFAKAMELQPNNSEAMEYSGYVHRRQGQLEFCLAELTRALEQDPRNASLAQNRADIFLQTREWAKARTSLQAAQTIDPRAVLGMRGILLSIINGTGNVDEAKKALSSYPSDSKLIVNSNVGDITGVTGDRAYLFVLARDYPAALRIWSDPATTPADTRRQLAARAAIRVLAGDLTGEQAEAETARQLLEQYLHQAPDDILTRTELSWVCLAQDRKGEAMKLTQESAALLTPEKDFLTGLHILAGEAMIASRGGAHAEAVAILKRLLSIPAGHAASIERLKVDPVWDPIRDEPGFQELLASKERVGP